MFWGAVLAPVWARGEGETSVGGKFLALGDSYTIGTSVQAGERWPAQTARLLASRGLALSVEYLAQVGWTSARLRLALETARLSPAYDLVSLLIGVNNYFNDMDFDSFCRDFEFLAQRAVALAGGRKERVVVLSIPDYGYTPYGRSRRGEISAGLSEYNRWIEAWCLRNGLAFVGITDITQGGLDDPQLVADDGLHPSGKAYSRFAERVLSRLEKILLP